MSFYRAVILTLKVSGFCKRMLIVICGRFVVKHLLMKPFVKGFLKKQQALYISDLAEALSTD